MTNSTAVLVYESDSLLEDKVHEPLINTINQLSCSECKVTIEGSRIFFEVNGDCTKIQEKIRTGEFSQFVAQTSCTLINACIDGECIYESLPTCSFEQPAFDDISQSDLKKKLNNIDVLLVTTTSIEKNAVLRRLIPLPDEELILRGTLWKTTFRLGQLGRYFVAHTDSTMGSLGRDGATLTVREAIDKLPKKPKAVIVVGIAFGVDRKKQRLGDVLIGESIAPYELAKIRNGTITHRGQQLSCGTLLSSRFRVYSDDWKMNRKLDLVKAHQGLILSGDKLIDDPAFLVQLRNTYPTAIGGEMEGCGAYAAAESAKVEIILVKGICDWANGEKNDEAQPFAALAAVSLVEHVLLKKDSLKDLGATDRGLAGEADIGLPKKKLQPQKRASQGAWHQLMSFVGLKRSGSDLNNDPVTPNANSSTATQDIASHYIEFKLSGVLDSEGLQKILELEIFLQSQGYRLKITKVSEGSMIFEIEGSREGLEKLQQLLDAGKLEPMLKRRVIGMSPVRQVAPLSLHEEERYFKRYEKGVVCHLNSITNFDKQHHEAIRLLSETTTRELASCKVYVTKGWDGYIYAHSNFIKPGRDYSTKIATRETNDLEMLLINLVSNPDSNQQVLSEIRRAHRLNVLYLINSTLFDNKGKSKLFLHGAQRIIEVSI